MLVSQRFGNGESLLCVRLIAQTYLLRLIEKNEANSLLGLTEEKNTKKPCMKTFGHSPIRLPPPPLSCSCPHVVSDHFYKVNKAGWK